MLFRSIIPADATTGTRDQIGPFQHPASATADCARICQRLVLVRDPRARHHRNLPSRWSVLGIHATANGRDRL
jgi:hypothetical protein